jgi:SNF2 family DNA or RNA helicase
MRRTQPGRAAGVDMESNSMKYTFKTKPYAHQREGIRFAFRQFNRGLGVGFLFEPRTGKTKTTIDTISVLHLKRDVRKVLVITPNRVLGTWVREFHTHCPLVHEVIVWDAKERRKGPIRQPAGHTDLQVVVTNFETFGTPGRRLPSGRRSKAQGRFKHRDTIEKWLAGEDAVLVVDESHKLKNPSSKAANMIVGMRRFFRYPIILTGTPITKAKRAADIYMQWRLISPDRFSDWGATYEDFKNHCGKWVMVEGNIPIFKGENQRGMRDLQRGIHQDALVIKRDECFDLPDELPDRIIDVPLTTSAKHYDEMAEDMITKLENGEIAEASIPLVVTMRLAQITSGHVGIVKPHPTNPDKTISIPVKVGTEKLKALNVILEEEVDDKDEPVIIVARWKADLDAIQAACKRFGMPVWSIRGGMTRDATDDALKRFKRAAGSACAMVVQPQAGGVGLDMSVAGHTVWYSLTSSWVDYRQMRDRNALHHKAVQHTFLIAPGTVDRLLYDTLQEDGNVASRILKRPDVLRRKLHAST